MIRLFYKHMARELAPELAAILRHLGKGGGVVFPACWRLPDVVPLPK